jgi:hypothetical protein
MAILAVYYTLADIVLLGQCFYYRGFSIAEEFSPSSSPEPELSATGALEGSAANAPAPTERSSLLPRSNGHIQIQDPATGQNGLHPRDGGRPSSVSSAPHGRRHSATLSDILNPQHVDGTHLSPATPLIEPSSDTARARRHRRRISTLQAILFNTTAIALVCAAGILGWYVSPGPKKSNPEPEPLTMDTLGQVFGYLCAVLYLGSRIPQLLLNYRRKSTDGVSMLFFLFACIGNLTYVLSILAYSPVCLGTSELRHRAKCRPGEASALYGRYVLVNLSWLIGSFGTLLLDMAIFVQFFLYRDGKDFDEEVDIDE